VIYPTSPIKRGRATEQAPEAKVELVRLSSIQPCPENDSIYAAPSTDDPDIIELVRSIRAYGLMEPIQISADNVIISGHRRRFCSILAGLSTVPAIRSAISYQLDREAFLRLLVEANTQRKKSAGMLLREVAMKVDPEQAYEDLRKEQRDKEDERRFGTRIGDQLLDWKDVSSRKKISKAKMPFLEAALRVIREHKEFWPLSVRSINYRLLGPSAPMRHASKPTSVFLNDRASYSDLCDLLSRGRIEGHVPWESIDDETRVEMLNNHFCNVGEFFEDQIKRFLSGYMRNRQQSQPGHIEIVAEKLTVKTILEGVAQGYSIPLTISRGQSGPTVKRKIAERFRRSKKKNLILLVVSDLDPAGETIAQNFRDDLESDFGISEDRIEVYRAGLNIGRVKEMDLEPSMEAKETSPTYASFVEKYGITHAYELEAMRPADLQEALRTDIEAVMDMNAYRAELAQERKDAASIAAAKSLMIDFLKNQGIVGACG
jgi:ParB-like chromosome segregation protein Spo0J